MLAVLLALALPRVLRAAAPHAISAEEDAASVFIAACDDGRMFALSPSTGEVRWMHQNAPVVIYDIPDPASAQTGVAPFYAPTGSHVMAADTNVPGVIVPAYDGSLWALRPTAPPEKLAKSVQELAMGPLTPLSGDLLVGEKHVSLTFLDVGSGAIVNSVSDRSNVSLVIERSDFVLNSYGGNVPMNLSVGTFDLHISVPPALAKMARDFVPNPSISPKISSDHSSIAAVDPETSESLWSFTPPVVGGTKSTIVSAFGLALADGHRWFRFNALRGVNGEEELRVDSDRRPTHGSGAQISLHPNSVAARSSAVVEVNGHVGGSAASGAAGGAAGAAFAAAAKFQARYSSSASLSSSIVADSMDVGEAEGGAEAHPTARPYQSNKARYSRVSSEGITLSWRVVVISVALAAVLLAGLIRKSDTVRAPFERAIQPCVGGKKGAALSPMLSPAHAPADGEGALLALVPPLPEPELPPALERLDALDPPNAPVVRSPSELPIMTARDIALRAKTSSIDADLGLQRALGDGAETRLLLDRSGVGGAQRVKGAAEAAGNALFRRTSSAPQSMHRLGGRPSPPRQRALFFTRLGESTVTTKNSGLPLRRLFLPSSQRFLEDESADGMGDLLGRQPSFTLSPGLSSVQPVETAAIDLIPALGEEQWGSMGGDGEGPSLGTPLPASPGTVGSSSGAATRAALPSSGAEGVGSGNPATPSDARASANQSRYAQEFVEIEEIGRGSFGAVFKVRNTLDSRTYAIKRITIPGVRPSVDESDATAKGKKWNDRLIRVLREVNALAELEHPHIVRYYNAWLEESTCLSSDALVRAKRASATWDGDVATTTRGGDDDDSTSVGGDTTTGNTSVDTSFAPSQVSQAYALSSQSQSQRGWRPNLRHQIGSLEPLSRENSFRTLQDSSFRSGDFKFVGDSIVDDSDVIEWIRSKEEEEEGEDEDASEGFRAGAAAELRPTSATVDSSLAATSVEATSVEATGVDTTATIDGSKSPTDGVRHPMPPSLPVGAEMTLLIQMEFCGKTLRDMLRHIGGRQRHPRTIDSSVAVAADGQKTMMSDGQYVDHVLRVMLQVAKALDHVHEVHGMVHRDLKPQNIFVMRNAKDATPQAYGSDWHHCLTGTETVKLGDFGLSRHTSARVEDAKTSGAAAVAEGALSPIATRKKQLMDAANAQNQEQMSSGVGTLLYMSPEQAEARVYDAKTDIFSLGVIFFELGARVFSTMMERIATLKAARRRDPAVLKAWPLGHACKGALQLLSELLAVNPADRPSSRDLISRLQFLRGERVLHHHEGGQLRGTTIRVEAEVREGEEDFGARLLATINSTVLAHPSVNITDIGLRLSRHTVTVELVVDATEQGPIESLLETLRGVSDRVTRAIAV